LTNIIELKVTDFDAKLTCSAKDIMFHSNQKILILLEIRPIKQSVITKKLIIIKSFVEHQKSVLS